MIISGNCTCKKDHSVNTKTRSPTQGEKDSARKQMKVVGSKSYFCISNSSHKGKSGMTRTLGNISFEIMTFR